MIKNILLVGAGSFLGGVMRYLVSMLLRSVGHGFPWGTFVANAVGCLLIGALWGWLGRCPGVSLAWNLLIGVGFCGGFTTFSTFSKESLAMLQAGNYTLFLLYAIGSMVIGLLCVWMGYLLAK